MAMVVEVVAVIVVVAHAREREDTDKRIAFRKTSVGLYGKTIESLYGIYYQPL